MAQVGTRYFARRGPANAGDGSRGGVTNLGDAGIIVTKKEKLILKPAARWMFRSRKSLAFSPRWRPGWAATSNPTPPDNCQALWVRVAVKSE